MKSFASSFGSLSVLPPEMIKAATGAIESSVYSEFYVQATDVIEMTDSRMIGLIETRQNTANKLR